MTSGRNKKAMTRQPIRNLDKVQAYLKTVPYGAMKESIKGVTEYVIGDERHGLRHDDPYQQTTCQAVYGRTFESDAQRRKVMAMIKNGEIKIGQRQHVPTEQSKGYGYKLTNHGYGATIENAYPGAHWARVWGGWKNWRSIPKVVQDNLKGAVRHATSRVNAYLRKKGK